MSHTGSIWVKINDLDIDLPNLHDGHNPGAFLPEDKLFACAIQDAADEETPVETLQMLSQKFAEAIFMTVQTTVDFFIYSHWCDGDLLREIQYSAEAGWYSLQGEPEPWETYLFDPAEKQRQLGYLDLERLAATPATAALYAQAQAQAAQIEATWAVGTLQAGHFYPTATATALYAQVMQAFVRNDRYLSRLVLRHFRLISGSLHVAKMGGRAGCGGLYGL